MYKFTIRKIFSSVPFLVGIDIFVVLVSFLESYRSDKWHWFGRSGAILIISGIFLTFRPSIRMSFDEWYKFKNTIDGGTWDELTPKEIEENKQEKLDANALIWGIYTTLIGTIIWAYGDLIGGL